MKDHAGMEMGGGPTKYKTDRQCLGRLFRVGQKPVVILPPDSVESRIASRIQSKILAMGNIGESTGKSLFPSAVNLLPCQKEVAEKMREALDSYPNCDSISM